MSAILVKVENFRESRNQRFEKSPVMRCSMWTLGLWSKAQVAQ